MCNVSFSATSQLGILSTIMSMYVHYGTVPARNTGFLDLPAPTVAPTESVHLSPAPPRSLPPSPPPPPPHARVTAHRRPPISQSSTLPRLYGPRPTEDVAAAPAASPNGLEGAGGPIVPLRSTSPAFTAVARDDGSRLLPAPTGYAPAPTNAPQSSSARHVSSPLPVGPYYSDPLPPVTELAPMSGLRPLPPSSPSSLPRAAQGSAHSPRNRLPSPASLPPASPVRSAPSESTFGFPRLRRPAFLSSNNGNTLSSNRSSRGQWGDPSSSSASPTQSLTTRKPNSTAHLPAPIPSQRVDSNVNFSRTSTRNLPMAPQAGEVELPPSMQPRYPQSEGGNSSPPSRQYPMASAGTEYPASTPEISRASTNSRPIALRPPPLPQARRIPVNRPMQEPPRFSSLPKAQQKYPSQDVIVPAHVIGEPGDVYPGMFPTMNNQFNPPHDVAQYAGPPFDMYASADDATRPGYYMQGPQGYTVTETYIPYAVPVNPPQDEDLYIEVEVEEADHKDDDSSFMKRIGSVFKKKPKADVALIVAEPMGLETVPDAYYQEEDVEMIYTVEQRVPSVPEAAYYPRWATQQQVAPEQTYPSPWMDPSSLGPHAPPGVQPTVGYPHERLPASHAPTASPTRYAVRQEYAASYQQPAPLEYSGVVSSGPPTQAPPPAALVKHTYAVVSTPTVRAVAGPVPPTPKRNKRHKKSHRKKDQVKSYQSVVSLKTLPGRKL
eukprot:GHVT01059352.1.p1 GENE.GHVT01059352.1~~GHVT01059352.1.p1  ORF type:complete len:719 (-),score=89.86 GHVT01059352.1:604-2760(-)